MIEIKDAIARAKEYITYVFDGEPLPGLKLEEVEYDDTQNTWLITFGFDTNRRAYTNTLLAGLTPEFVREYKLVAVRAEDGKVESMKIRNLWQSTTVA